jgi:membrane associated rhomboid family serine protease
MLVPFLALLAVPAANRLFFLGIVHLFMNLLAQLRFGVFLERQWGLYRIVPLYFVSGVGGAVLSGLWNINNPDTVSVGASGAIVPLIVTLFHLLRIDC